MDLIAYCQSVAPQEACGFILADQSFYPCINVSVRPEQAFEISPDDWISCGQEVVAIVHSHPKGEPFLSGRDRQMQVQLGLPWWLVVDDKVKRYRPVPHLQGRPFVYGQQDCYSILEDGYHLAGIELPQYQRLGIDEESDQNAFLTNFPNAGFYQIEAPNVGDVILTSSDGTANHAALYVGDNRVLHHARGCLSRVELYGHSWRRRTHSFWRHQQWSQLSFMAILQADLNHSM